MSRSFDPKLLFAKPYRVLTPLGDQECFLMCPGPKSKHSPTNSRCSRPHFNGSMLPMSSMPTLGLSVRVSRAQDERVYSQLHSPSTDVLGNVPLILGFSD
uniref:Uncharacterized protein n=1 Tax=Coccidioides posadasii RMSCC 3488 TaxID=454284 RepID=A0A0J6F7E0_COCPO|nr:hypothetical protein CPAG_01196 [Coccidioides posadasii RMSCC 3488]